MHFALPASLKLLRTLFVRLVLLCQILTQAQLPAVFAEVLIEADGTHELRVCVNEREVRLTLHHAEGRETSGRLLHEHSGVLALLAGDSHGSESDHVICFASVGAVTAAQSASDQPAVAVAEFLSPQPLKSVYMWCQAMSAAQVPGNHRSVWHEGLCSSVQLPLLI